MGNYRRYSRKSPKQRADNPLDVPSAWYEIEYGLVSGARARWIGK